MILSVLVQYRQDHILSLCRGRGGGWRLKRSRALGASSQADFSHSLKTFQGSHFGRRFDRCTLIFLIHGQGSIRVLGGGWIRSGGFEGSRRLPEIRVGFLQGVGFRVKGFSAPHRAPRHRHDTHILSAASYMHPQDVVRCPVHAETLG